MALEQTGLQWINEGLQGFFHDVDRGNAAMQSTGDAAESASNGLNPLSGVLIGVSTAITTFLLDAFKKASAAVIGFAKDSVSMATEFQSAATRLQIAGTGAATQAGIALDQLSESALKVGGDTRLLGVNATGAAESITELLKAGLSVDQVMGDFNAYMNDGAELGGVLAAAIKTAAASELDMVEASNLASTSMTIFGLDANDMTSQLDYIIRGADASVAEVGDLRDALEGAGPTLRGFGFTLEDSVDALALLSNAGIRGAQAGTALRSAWTQLTSDKKKVVAALEEQGIALTNAEGNYYSFGEVLGQLQVATENMTQAQRAEFLQTVAGAYGKTALTALLDQGVEGYEAYANALENAAGIERQSTENAATLASAQEALDGVMETLRIRVGTAFIPVFNTVTRLFSDLVEKYSPPIISAFELVGSTLEGFIGILTTTADEGDILLDYLQKIPEPLQPIAEVVGGIILAFQDFREGVLGADYPWEDIFPPAVADFMYKLVENFTMVKNWVDTNWPKIQETITSVWENIMTAFNTAKDWFENDWPIVFEKIQEVWLKVQAVFLTAWHVVSSLVMAIVDAIKPAFEDLFETLGGVEWDVVLTGLKSLGKVALGIAAAVGAAFVGLLGVISGVVRAIVNVIDGVIEIWDDAMESIKGIIQGFAEKDMKKVLKSWGKLMETLFVAPFKVIWKAVSGFCEGVYDFFKNLWKQLVGGSLIPDMMDAIQKVFEDTLDAILDFVKKWIEKIIDWFDDLKTDLERIWENLWDSIEDTIDKVVSAIETTISNFIDSVTKWWDDFTDDIKEAWGNLWDDVKSIVTEKVATIKAAIEQFVESIKTKWTEFIENLKQQWTDLFSRLLEIITEKAQAFIDKGREIIEWIRQGIEDAWSILTGWISSALSNIGQIITNVASSIIEFGKSIVTKIVDGFKAAWESETGIIGFMKKAFTGLIDTLSDVWIHVVKVGAAVVEKITKGVSEAWSSLITFIKTSLEGEDNGILGAVVRAGAKIVEAGKKIVDWLREGINNAWDDFVNWIKDKLVGWLNDNPESYPGAGTSNITSTGNSLLAGRQMAAAPVSIPSSMGSTTIDRSTTVEVNANYGYQSEAGIYYDVQAALIGVGR